MPESYQLTVRRGPQQGQSYPLLSSVVTIGRDPMADVVIADPEVSRQHVRLMETDAGYQIQDLGSTNGTFVEGRRLGGEAVPLSPGQIVALGSNVTLVFEEVEDAAATIIASGQDLFPEDEDEIEPEEPDVSVGVYEAPAVAEPAQTTPLQEGDEELFEESEFDDSAEKTVLDFGYEDDADLDFPAFDEPEEEEFELPSFDEPEVETYDFSSYDESPDLDEDLEEPDYDVYEEEEDALPTFGAEPVDDYPAPDKVAATRDYSPPPPPPAEPPARNNRNRNLIIGAVLVLFLLCCCCLLIASIWLWNNGDALLGYY